MNELRREQNDFFYFFNFNRRTFEKILIRYCARIFFIYFEFRLDFLRGEGRGGVIHALVSLLEIRVVLSIDLKFLFLFRVFLQIFQEEVLSLYHLSIRHSKRVAKNDEGGGSGGGCSSSGR